MLGIKRERVQWQATTERTSMRFCFITPTIGLIYLHCIRELITSGRQMEKTGEAGCGGVVMKAGKDNLYNLSMTSKVARP